MFPSSINIILNGQYILYPLKQKDKCDYNHRCLMSRGLISDDIIINISRNKSVNQQVEVVDSYLSKTENNKIYMYRGSTKYFILNKGTHESLGGVSPHFNVER